MKIEILFPGMHSVTLDEAIGVLARDAAFHQIEQQLTTEDQSFGALKIGEHALGINKHHFDQVGRLVEQVIGERMLNRDDDALGGRVRDVSFMPEWNVFKSGLPIRTDYASEAADLFCVHW